MGNKATLTGNLGSDLTVRTTTTGKTVANVNLATNITTQTGERFTEWHRLVIWGDKALEAAKTFKKGAWVEVEGSIRHQSYTDRDGVERRSDMIVVGVIKPGPRKQQQPQQKQAVAAGEPLVSTKDLIF